MSETGSSIPRQASQLPIEHEGIYPKYLVFKHPDYIPEVISAWSEGESQGTQRLILVEDFVFVLKPNTDRHARVAMAAYAESIRSDNPGLSIDLKLLVEGLE